MLENKVAVITGSTSGIGLGIARSLASAGADILLNGFGDPAEIEKLRRNMADKFRVRVASSRADMSDPEQVRAVVELAHSPLGRADILVNNAGIQYTAPVQEFPAERWDAIIAINLSSAFHVISAALPTILQRDWGRIINGASAHGLVGSPQKSAYVAAKHGMVGLTNGYDLHNLKCHLSRLVLTPLVQKQIDDRAAKEGIPAANAKDDLVAEKQPPREFVTPEQLGALTVFLCSDTAAQVRGQALAMDGGWTAQ